MNTTPQPARRTLTPAVVEALLVDTTPWLSCEECFDQMDTYVEALAHNPEHHEPAMSRHLQGCVACDEEARSLLALLKSGT